MIRYILIALAISISLGCNNNRSNRLSARGYCKPKNDPAAYSLNIAEKKALIEADVPTEGTFAVEAFASTLTVADVEENKVTLTIKGSRLLSDSPIVALECAANLISASAEPIVHDTPITNRNGEFSILRTTIEFGNPTQEDNSDYFRMSAEVINNAVEENSEGETSNSQTPQTFSDYYSAPADDLKAYIFRDEKKRAEDDTRYFLHHRNTERSSGVIRVTTRLTLIDGAPPEQESENSN